MAANDAHFVYAWFDDKEGIPLPFYVGISKNESRLKDTYSRSKAFKNRIKDCENPYAKKIAENLSLEEAASLEHIIKVGIQATGCDIIDAESNLVEKQRRMDAAREAMPVIDGRKTSIKTGRPCGKPAARDYVDMEKFEKLYSEVKDKKKSNIAAARELGVGYTTWYRLVDYVKYPDRSSPYSYNRKR